MRSCVFFGPRVLTQTRISRILRQVMIVQLSGERISVFFGSRTVISATIVGMLVPEKMSVVHDE